MRWFLAKVEQPRRQAAKKQAANETAVKQVLMCNTVGGFECMEGNEGIRINDVSGTLIKKIKFKRELSLF